MNGTLPFAVGIAASEASPGLGAGIRLVVSAINLAEVLDARLGRFLLGIATRNFQELQRVLAHYAACLSDSNNDPSSAAFGLTSQNLGANER